mmetsp:Transcript_37144/g.41522  ORF Transcript_37144/g.41522 Transcript_37144/m.41522 type:complete len:87 (-) Transcript_37144:76-336(-)
MPGGGAVVLLDCSGRAQALIGAGAEGFAPLLFVKVLISVLLELDLWPPFVDIFNILFTFYKTFNSYGINVCTNEVSIENDSSQDDR